MSVDVYIQSGLSIQVTENTSAISVSVNSGVTVQVSPISPSYVIGNLPVLVGTGNQYATQGWVTSGFYPLDNPSGFATGIDASAFVRRTESGVFATTGQFIEFSTILTSGVESQPIFYPLTLPYKPKSIICEIENNVDNLIYSHVLISVNITGFTINFSDNLSSTGYILYTSINL